MRKIVNVVAFRWNHGWPDRWRIVEAAGHYYVVYRDGVPGDGDYDPFGPDGASLLLDFAAIAQLALKRQKERGFNATALADAGGIPTSTHAPMGDQIAVERAEELRDVRTAVLRFVRQYGAPSFMPYNTPGFDLRERPYAVTRLLRESLDVQRAKEHSRKAKEEGDEEAETLLCSWLVDHLEGVRFNPRPKQPGFTCTRLLDVLWLGIHDAHFGPGKWATCEGCRGLFVQGRADQLYHSTSCRSAAGARKSRSKGSN